MDPYHKSASDKTDLRDHIPSRFNLKAAASLAVSSTVWSASLEESVFRHHHLPNPEIYCLHGKG